MAVIAGGAESSPGVEFMAYLANIGAFWEHRSAEVCVEGVGLIKQK